MTRTNKYFDSKWLLLWSCLAFCLNRQDYFYFFVGAIELESSTIHTTTRNSIPWTSGSEFWQPTEAINENTDTRLEDLPPTVFSPTGRLYSVENMSKAAISPENTSSNLVVALKYDCGILVMSTIPLSPHFNNTFANLLLVNQTISPVFFLSPNIIGAAGGNAVDVQIMRRKLQAMAKRLLEISGESTHVSEISRHLADHLQVATQNSGGSSSLLACFGLLVGKGEIWRIDPTGQFWKCQAIALGRASAAANEELYQRAFKINRRHPNQIFDDLSLEEATELVETCIKSALFGKKRTTSSSLDKLPPVYWRGIAIENKASNNNEIKTTILRGIIKT